MAVALRALAACCVGGLGCGDLEFDGIILWEGEFTRVGVEAGSELTLDDWCPGNLAHMDEVVSAHRQTMGITDAGPIDFFVLEAPAEDILPGCAGGIGCAKDRAAFSPHVPHDHELVHAVRNGAGSSPQFFEEGAASYWGDLVLDFDLLHGVPDEGENPGLRETVDAAWSRRLSRAEYRVAAHFTGFLTHTYGSAASAELLRSTGGKSSRANTETAFAAAIGVSLDEAIELYEEGWPACSYEATRDSTRDCSGDAVPLCVPGEEDRLEEVEVEVSCGEPTTLGPREGWMWRDVVVDLRRAGVHRLSADAGPAGARHSTVVTLKRCDSMCNRAEPMELPVQDGGNLVNRLEEDLEAGQYLFRVYREADAAGSVTLLFECAPA